MSLEPGTVLGAYEILAPLGKGGMGEVYRARDTKLRREVAIKVLPDVFSSEPDRLARFRREGELLATLNHPNIAAVFGFEESVPSTGGATPVGALVLELVEGETLAERIARGPVPLDEALPIARQIADALEAAHERGIIHRDLKPANIKIAPDGRVKVLDFGLAKMLEGDPHGASVSLSPTLSAGTRAGVILGTAAYMSPEQARGRPVDRRTDIWSFGCVVFEMLAGRRVFDSGDTVSDAVAAILRTDPDWTALPPGTPEHIRRLLRRCLEKDAQRRLPHIGVARLEIDEPADAPAQAGTGDARAALHAARRRARVAWIAAAILLATTAALAAWIVWNRQPAPADAIRFVIAAPEGARFGHSAGPRGPGAPAPHFAPSPDGRRLAYVMYTTGKPQLWVRQLDSLSGEPLAGTDDASFPFWSPDGRFIAFFAEGKLRKIDAGGGPPQTICDARGGEGGDWNSDGDIVFAPDTLSGLFRVSSAGGRPTPLTTLDKEQQEDSHRWPQFLPGGRRFLYLAMSRRGPGDAKLYAASLDSADRTLILTGAMRTSYRSGHLLFMRGSTLLAQTFDARSLGLSGDPIPIAEDVGANLGNGRTGFAASDRALVYRTGGGPGDDGASAGGVRELAWIDRTGTRIATIGRPDRYAALRLSPDGQRAVVAIGNPTATTGQDLWILDLARNGVPTRFTFAPERVNTAAIWSPDGSRIIFSTGDRTQLDVFQKASSGTGEAELLYKSSVNPRPSSWSSDGNHVLFTQGGLNDSDLWVLPLTGDRKPYAFVSTPFGESVGQFAPGGQWVAYQSNKTGAMEVYVRAFQGSDRESRISVGGGQLPQWRGDGRELFYVAQSSVMAVAMTLGDTLTVGTPQKLFDLRPGNPNGRLAVAADGKRFLIIEPTAAQADPSEMIVVLNWDAALKR